LENIPNIKANISRRVLENDIKMALAAITKLFKNMLLKYYNI